MQLRFNILACFFYFHEPPLIAEVFLFTGVYIGVYIGVYKY